MYMHVTTWKARQSTQLIASFYDNKGSKDQLGLDAWTLYDYP